MLRLQNTSDGSQHLLPVFSLALFISNPTVPLYRCTSARYGEFLNREAGCEGDREGNLLGYALP